MTSQETPATHTDNHAPHHFDLLCMGRSSLDLMGNEVGALFEDLSGFQAYVGGSPTNICVAGQRLGLKTAMLTGVGDDYVSTFILKFLQQEGVDTNAVIRKPGTHTNTVMVALQPPDEMQFVAYHTNNADLELTIDDMLQAPIAQSRVLQFSGMGLLKEPSRSATQYLVEYARSQGTKIVMDLDYRAPMWSDPRIYGITTRLTLPMVDIATGTVDEVRAAAGHGQLEGAVETLLGQVQEALIVKKGGEGCTVYTVDGQVTDVPPFKVNVVNFLGAGDAFAAGFVYGYLNRWELAKAARLGNACGAIIVSEHGTANAMPRLQTVLDFIEAHGGF